jgi:tRNA dimethylallyltransferase
VQRLLEAGYQVSDPGMSSIGYREVCAHLNGEMTLEEVKARMRQLTHTFVRRQANWFKSEDPFIHWFDLRKNDILNDIIFTITNDGNWRIPTSAEY